MPSSGPPVDAFGVLSDPGQADNLDDLVERLRALKVWAGNPSFEWITGRVKAAWTAAENAGSAGPSVSSTRVATASGVSGAGWTTVASGSATIWFAIVCRFDAVKLTISFGVLHVLPPFVVFEKYVGPRNADVWRFSSGLPFGASSRSQTA